MSRLALSRMFKKFHERSFASVFSCLWQEKTREALANSFNNLKHSGLFVVFTTISPPEIAGLRSCIC